MQMLGSKASSLCVEVGECMHLMRGDVICISTECNASIYLEIVQCTRYKYTVNVGVAKM